MVPPPAKRPRLTASASALGAPGGSTTRRTTRSQKPRLSPELLAKVASFAQIGQDLMNLCVVAGPRDCRLIRYTYLRFNLHYPRFFLRNYVTVKGDIHFTRSSSKICGDRYRAWMEVNNPSWKRLVSDAKIKKLASVRSQTSANTHDVVLHSHAPLNNPFVAIELGLMEALKHLVEEKDIDVNSYQWNSYKATTLSESSHLLAACLCCENREAFKYLLGRSSIDINAKAMSGHYLNIAMLTFLAPHSTSFFRDLIGHPDFDLTTGFFSDDETLPPLIWAMEYYNEDGYEELCDLTTFKANFKLLLAAGADPCAEDENYGFNAIQFAEAMVKGDPESQGMKAALEILKDWGGYECEGE